MECFESRFDEYFAGLQTVSERKEILNGLQSTFKMLYQMKIIGSVPEIVQFQSTKGIIECYLNSSLRSEYFQKLERNAAEFAQAVGPMAIRNFLLTETILATKSSEFVHQLTREMFLNGTKIIDSNQQTGSLKLDKKKHLRYQIFSKKSYKCTFLLLGSMFYQRSSKMEKTMFGIQTMIHF